MSFEAMTIKPTPTRDESVIVVTFDPSLSGDQVEATLTALAKYSDNAAEAGYRQNLSRKRP